MKPIPTAWNGVQYRSRLEARWAMFFDNIGINSFYEPFEIKGGGKTYLPDFFLMGLTFPLKTHPIIAEIKPLTPNSEYISHLMAIREPGKSDFLILVGEPSFLQPLGIWIYGSNKNYIRRGFSLNTCERCGFYVVADYPSFDTEFCPQFSPEVLCECCAIPPPPKSDWQKLAEIAKNFRFDL